MSQTNLEPQEHLLIRTVRELAAEKPDFVYKTTSGMCLYTPDQEQPGCIFGQALLKMGYTREDLMKFDDNNGGMFICTVLNELGIKKAFSEKELRWCKRVQYEQDHNHSWVEAITYADKPE